MKVLITTHAQIFCSPDGRMWTKSVYSYNFFQRYLRIFETVLLISRVKKISFSEIGSMLLVSGKGMEFCELPFYRGPWQFAKQYPQIKKIVNKNIEKCDCAILRIPDQLSFQIFRKLKKLQKPTAVEVVAHPRDLYAPGTIKSFLRPFLRIIWDINQKRICRLADGVAYVTKDYLQGRYQSGIKSVNKERFETYYTSADLHKIYFTGVREINDFKKSCFKIIHISGINNHAKGHKELLEMMYNLKNKGLRHYLTFVGGGVLLEEFKKMCYNLGLEENIKFVGNVSEAEEITSLLKQSDLFIFPTMTEGLPRVILEAMAGGLPCISTNVGGIGELIANDLLVKPNSVNCLEEKFKEIISSPEKLLEESKKNYKKAVNNYSYEIITKKRDEFYTRLKALAKKFNKY